MATVFQNLGTPLEIPAESGKIIKIDRLIQVAQGAVLGTRLLRIQSNSNPIFPSFACGSITDFAWSEHQPQGERSQSVVIDISGGEPLVAVWVAYRYVD
jgi:hypothetical protein